MPKYHNSFFISSIGKLKVYRNSKWNFLSSCFTADESHVKIVRKHVAVFTEPDILHFWHNVRSSKCYLAKVPFESKFSFALEKYKIDLNLS